MKFGLKPKRWLGETSRAKLVMHTIPWRENEGVEGRSGGAEEEDWVNGWPFISRFPHPVSCKDGHPI